MSYLPCYLQFPGNVSPANHSMLNELLDWLVPPCLDYVRLKCKMLILSSPSHLVVTMLRLFHCLLDEIIAAEHKVSEEEEPMTDSQVGEANSTSYTKRRKWFIFNGQFKFYKL